MIWTEALLHILLEQAQRFIDASGQRLIGITTEQARPLWRERDEPFFLWVYLWVLRARRAAISISRALKDYRRL